MSTIIMLFILPLGIVVYFWDRRNYAQSLVMFKDYCVKMNHADLSENEKMDCIDEMFYQNGYIRIERADSRLVIEKKTFQYRGAIYLFGSFDLYRVIGLFDLLPFFSQSAKDYCRLGRGRNNERREKVACPLLPKPSESVIVFPLH